MVVLYFHSKAYDFRMRGAKCSEIVGLQTPFGLWNGVGGVGAYAFLRRQPSSTVSTSISSLVLQWPSIHKA